MRWRRRQRRQVYEQLAAIEAGFELVARALRVFRKSGFEPSEIERLSEMTAESRAATLSYLTNIIETLETAEAGRVQRRRLKRERAEDGTRR